MSLLDKYNTSIHVPKITQYNNVVTPAASGLIQEVSAATQPPHTKLSPVKAPTKYLAQFAKAK